MTDAQDGQHLRGIVLMVVAMLTVPLADGIAKALSDSLSPLFISWARYAVAACIVVPLAALRLGPRHVFPREDLAAHTLRTMFLVAAMTLYFVAIARLPLATAITGYLVGPVIAVFLSVAFFGEPMTRAKGLSLVLGLAGTLVILRPGSDISLDMLLALGSGALFACYLIATRRAAARTDPFQTLAFQCTLGALLLTPQAVFTATPVPATLWPMIAAIGALSVIVHMLTILAARLTEASTLAPLVYVELLGSVLVGFLWFGDLPGPAIVIGGALIVGAGLVLLRRPATATVR
ncbi:DMT family transporter [Hasllibacter sp. MH4015]|uniref:DMT family transporter n=1 Tax=Hasllibacter sp. MH4015 TaxID=2854029 RepID=UPI001CD26465|nr:DMT family transporter [Hasllibacter sp. MH4015]